MPSIATVYEPDLVWTGAAFEPGVLAVNEAGRVASASSVPAAEGARRVRLPGRALLPGMVNAHSHAFQRLLRGRTEYLALEHSHDDFWTWRERMYRAAARLTPEGLYAASRQAFLEMALAGITTVGEFHYLQHAPDGKRYDDPNLLARTVVRAARDVGLRVVLMRVGYARAGHEKALEDAQRRFVDASPEEWLKAIETLTALFREDSAVTVAHAPHSVRALPRAWLEALAAVQPARVHMHVAEQAGEVQACLAEHGTTPVALLAGLGLLSPGFTAVHAIHLGAEERHVLGQAGAHVCACPSTERNLGDGVLLADALLAEGVELALGTDSQVSIDLIDDARQLEGHLRLLRQRRSVLDPGEGEPQGLSRRLLAIATEGGARSLGLPVGTLAPGTPADFFTVDLQHPTLAGAAPGALLGALFAGGSAALVREVAVNGRLIVESGEHPLREVSGRELARVAEETFE